MTENLLPIESSQFLLYTAESGKVHIEVFAPKHIVICGFLIKCFDAISNNRGDFILSYYVHAYRILLM